MKRIAFVLIMALVVFAGLYLAFRPEASLAPGSKLGCTNRYDTETFCSNLSLCQRTVGTTLEYAPLLDNGDCEKGYTKTLITTQNMDSLCAIANSMSKRNIATEPPICAPGCNDRGISPFEDRGTGLCCTAGTERTCTDNKAQN